MAIQLAGDRQSAALLKTPQSAARPWSHGPVRRPAQKPQIIEALLVSARVMARVETTQVEIPIELGLIEMEMPARRVRLDLLLQTSIGLCLFEQRQTLDL